MSTSPSLVASVAPTVAATADLTDFFSLTAGHRSHPPVTGEPVSPELIEQVYEALRWGPTAMNSSPLRLLVVQPGEARERLVSFMSQGNQERVQNAPLTLVVAADPNFHLQLPTLAPHMQDAIAGFDEQSQWRASFARENSYLQLGYLILGLRAAGLTTGPMTGMDSEAIDAEFFADSEWRSFAVVNVGWPSDAPNPRPRAARLSAQQAVRVI